MSLNIFISLPFFLFSLLNCYSTEKKLQINFRPVVKNIALQLNTKAYFIHSQDSIFITTFKMYVGKIVLNDDELREKIVDENYHLLNVENVESMKIDLKNLSLKKISSIDFFVGVDSIENMKGALDGDLDVSNAMYWTWNSGFINFKLEGHSPICKSIHHAFEFHIGGFKHPNNTIRKIHLQLKNPIIISAENKLNLNINLAEIFNSVDLQTQNSIVEPGKEAVEMANHFQKMFSVEE